MQRRLSIDKYSAFCKPLAASFPVMHKTCSMKAASHGKTIGPSLGIPNSSSATSRSFLKISFSRRCLWEIDGDLGLQVNTNCNSRLWTG
ncbi:hypothetical protein AKJ16_DCAP12182 [Drosera capensis]